MESGLPQIFFGNIVWIVVFIFVVRSILRSALRRSQHSSGPPPRRSDLPPIPTEHAPAPGDPAGGNPWLTSGSHQPAPPPPEQQDQAWRYDPQQPAQESPYRPPLPRQQGPAQAEPVDPRSRRTTGERHGGWGWSFRTPPSAQEQLEALHREEEQRRSGGS